ncbi:BTAD domain-containing putative transcriptional regulator [Micromonospora sp. NPDC047738]|uniref:AfsR/SARP family transcriptional regulator n=1 Tax=Micromonospora sp. NPDC047738 TaxID=3155741 RepID=UPI0033E0C754
MEFRLLGPVEFWRDGRQVQLTGHKLRSVMAVLALNVGRPVPADRLIRLVWAEDAPPSAPRLLQHQVSSLRALLPDPALIHRSPAGYELRTPPEQIDLHVFDAQCESAADALRGGDADLAARQLRSALALWRGPALSGTTEELTTAFGPALEERRLAALLNRIDADLRVGRHLQLLAELSQLAADHPFDERLRGQLILALDRAGRKADAVDAYQQIRRLLADELGIEPGPLLQRTFRQVLGATDEDNGAVSAGGEPTPPSAPAAATTGSPTPSRVPRQLPATVPDFVGRAEALTALHTLLTGGHAVSAIVGPAGVGKTTLAVHWSHTAARHFPDGQLFADLRGYDRDEPVAPQVVIGGLLRALGVPADEVPPDLAERTALYRTLLADRAVLVLLDNVRSAEQVRPLLPGSNRCAVVVTSRDELAGLVARDGARRIILTPLTAPEGRDLLRRTLGADRVEAEPAAATMLTMLCDGLPLALRLAAERMSRHPDTRLTRLVKALELEAHRLETLDAAGDPAAAVRAAFSWSYLALPPAAARMFRLLGLHPAAEIDPTAAANLAGLTGPEASRLLTTLAGVHLVTETAPTRYRMHDLLRVYALEQCRAEEPAPARRAAVARLLAGYDAAARRAVDLVAPHRRRLPAAPPPGSLVLPTIASYDEALAWLDTERGTLVVAVRYAVAAGEPAYSWHLAHTLWRYFLLGRHLDDWLTSHQAAALAAREAGDRTAEAEMLNSMAAADTHGGRSARAVDRYQRVIELMRELGDQRGEAGAVGNLGTAYHRIGRYAQARRHYLAALDLCTDEDPRDRAFLLGNIAEVSYLLGDHADALRHYERSLAVSEDADDRYAETFARIGLGATYRELGRLDAAGRHLEHALQLSREHADQHDEAACLGELGLLRLRQGRPVEALQHLDEGLDLGRRVGDPNLTAMVLIRRGDTLSAIDSRDDAERCYREALDIADAARDRLHQAQAHRGLATVRQAAGERGGAAQHRRQAYDLFVNLGLPVPSDVAGEDPPGRDHG